MHRLPATEEESQAKRFVDRLEGNAVRVDDAIRFDRGMPGMQYS